ncbi:microfibril-associated glycoprotein 4-like [Uranotaenia lowii]|uniref:microfibril-associated glycoprotein 4-like n=1 Tax=Uranotaenia lowii TaxID=190385 RepID=UPI0024790E3C|nr:microfibril-associated glycoprotein 4-like [Uranotaenia lowii]
MKVIYLIVLVFGGSVSTKDLKHRSVRSCADVKSYESGVYTIQPNGFGKPFEVYCDQEYLGGGWTVFQNRFNGTTNFYRDWNSYVNGFGDWHGEFWLGLDRIHELTYSQKNELHVVLEDFSDVKAVAKYSDFLVAGPSDSYRLRSVGTYSGTAGDSLSFSLNGPFQTYDKFSNTKLSIDCPVVYEGAYWYGLNGCFKSHLNGVYLKGAQDFHWKMMCWEGFKGSKYSLKASRMMIRPI